MKINSFDIKGMLVIVPSAIAPFSAFASQSFSWRLLIGVVIAAVVAGMSAWRGYLSMPPSTPDTTTITVKSDTPGVAKSDIVDKTA